MRIVKVKAPQGHGKDIVQVAFEAGLKQVTIHQANCYAADNSEAVLDVVEIETSTPSASRFIHQLMTAPFYNAANYTFSLEHPVSLFTQESPKEITNPVKLPTTDVYEELWQFTSVTYSLVGRVFLSAVLLAYGMVEGLIPVLVAGLLFLPYHHHMLCFGLGIVLKELRFLLQGLLAMVVSTLLIFLAGISVGLFTEPQISYQEFGSPLEGFILSVVIGVAAALAAIDDAGRRELIGLAATAHISVHPAWIGLHLVFGFDDNAALQNHLLVFCINLTTLTMAATITFSIVKMHGAGIRKFVKDRTGAGNT